MKKLIDQIENSTVDEARSILCPRGHNCISKSMLKKARDARKGAKSDEEIIVNLMKKVSYLKEKDGKLYMIYPKCYCHHLKSYKGDVPKNYCYCSEAWVQHMFEEALGRKVDVEIETSVLWGDEECRMRVRI